MLPRVRAMTGSWVPGPVVFRSSQQISTSRCFGIRAKAFFSPMECFVLTRRCFLPKKEPEAGSAGSEGSPQDQGKQDGAEVKLEPMSIVGKQNNIWMVGGF